jgi:hypothetical protein
MDNDERKIVYWHRELPPLHADLMAEHTVEATSGANRWDARSW